MSDLTWHHSANGVCVLYSGGVALAYTIHPQNLGIGGYQVSMPDGSNLEPVSTLAMAKAMAEEHFAKVRALSPRNAAPVEKVSHPAHYGGKDDPYEAIKVIFAWKLGFCLGNVLKYIKRADEKDGRLVNLKKARQYLDFEIAELEKNNG